MCPAFALADADAGLLEKVVEGIFVSVIVAALGVAITSMWRGGRAFINRLFGRIPVQGKWTTKLTRDAAPEEHERAELNQFLNRVWGKTETWPKPPDGEVKNYKVGGWIQGQNLILTYRQTDDSGSDSGVIVLHIKHSGGEMVGYEVGPDTKSASDEIKAFKYEWTRSAPDAAGTS